MCSKDEQRRMAAQRKLRDGRTRITGDQDSFRLTLACIQSFCHYGEIVVEVTSLHTRFRCQNLCFSGRLNHRESVCYDELCPEMLGYRGRVKPSIVGRRGEVGGEHNRIEPDG